MGKWPVTNIPPTTPYRVVLREATYVPLITVFQISSRSAVTAARVDPHHWARATFRKVVINTAFGTVGRECCAEKSFGNGCFKTTNFYVYSNLVVFFFGLLLNASCD